MKKILFVDDEPDMLKIVSLRLNVLGYDVTTASNGREALDIIQKMTPDLVLLDLRMPLASGYDVYKYIKTNEKFRSIPVILFTTSFAHDLSLKAKELGADDYITKPFDPPLLAGKIGKLIGN
ncbi:MAG: response regulator [Candidatus Omnitrophota bacterium]|nr:response regulator [Candidatus Omnitrophota bacterium]